MNISVRQAHEEDLSSIVNYFYQASDEHLKGMGADPTKLPALDGWLALLKAQLSLSYPAKEYFYMIWELEGEAIGHNNINQIKFGQQAFMHLHLWKELSRKKGLGTALLRKSIPYFFKFFELQNLYCEPFAGNPAPNRTLAKLGFQLERTYVTIPGTINYQQEVNRWCLSKLDFEHNMLNL